MAVCKARNKVYDQYDSAEVLNQLEFVSDREPANATRSANRLRLPRYHASSYPVKSYSGNNDYTTYLHRQEVERDQGITYREPSMLNYDPQFDCTEPQKAPSGYFNNQPINTDMHGERQTVHSPVKRTPSKVHHLSDNSIGSNSSGYSEIAQVVKQLQRPPIELRKFSGNCTEYNKFIRQFESKVVANTDTDEERMNYLEQYTTGEANRIVSGFGYLDNGYEAALKELKLRYGNPHVIACSYVDKALKWPVIRYDDAKGLDNFAIFLAECKFASKSVEALRTLEYPETIKRLLAKLPTDLHNKWRNLVQQDMERDVVITFSRFVDFVAKEAFKANDPMYGRQAIASVSDRPDLAKCRGKFGSTAGKANVTPAKSFAAVTSASSNGKNSKQETRPVASKSPVNKTESVAVATVSSGNGEEPCAYCHKSNHVLNDCRELLAKPKEDRLSFLRSTGRCFGCLTPGHMNSTCPSKRKCAKCLGNHSTLLHVELPPKAQELSGDQKLRSEVVSSCSAAGAVDLDEPETKESKESFLAIIPVKVRRNNGCKVIETYAFLDTGSTKSFCSENLMDQLYGACRETVMKVKTLNHEESICTHELKDLVVSGLDGNSENILIPSIYTSEIPVSRGHIPVQKDLEKWPHLSDVVLPSLEAGIDLLIGYDIADAYTPLEVRTGPKGTPHATRSRLGWIPWNIAKTDIDHVNVNFIESKAQEIRNLETLMENAINMDFPERAVDDKREHSRDDALFLEKVDRSINLVDNHYQIDLPFREPIVRFPNNLEQAENCLHSLKSRMGKNSQFREDYKSFMFKILDKGYAEKIPENRKTRDDGKVWHIPHHGVYHPRKKDKIRVVFDYASRGLSVNKMLECKDWFDGPEFIWKSESEWPSATKVDNALSSGDVEVIAAVSDVKVKPVTFLNRFSNWNRLKRVVAWLFLFIRNTQKRVLKRKNIKAELVQKGLVSPRLDLEIVKGLETLKSHFKVNYLSSGQLREAEKSVLIMVQREGFAEELEAMKVGQQLKRSSVLCKLNPVMMEGLLRVGGRLSRTDALLDVKHPILLPKSSHVSKLVICDVHQQVGHMSKNTMLSTLRQSFWVLGANSIIKQVISNCIECKKYHAQTLNQKMADLPVDRVIGGEPPFNRAGMDFFGPFEIKRGRVTVKRYGVIFTCLNSRAVHLEVAHSLETNSCIDAIRRFICRRGTVQKIVSDNGTNLVGANKEMSAEIRCWNQSAIVNALHQKGIQWEFNPPSASHFGGVWERLIRSVRKILYSLLRDQPGHLNEESLTTLFCEVEAILNNRPITKLSDDPHDLDALTPNHLSFTCPAMISPGLLQRHD